MDVPVTRSKVRLLPDPARLITKAYLPHDDGEPVGTTRIDRVIQRVRALPADEVERTVAKLRRRFSRRHADIDGVFRRGFEAVAHLVDDDATLPDAVRSLLGAYFVHEYSLEGAALTNPSIVPSPDQSGVEPGWLRVIVSVRAVGEGHLSSIEFRTGLVGPDGEIDMDAPSAPESGERRSPRFERHLFAIKLQEMGADSELAGEALGQLDAMFTMADLERALSQLSREDDASSRVQHVIQTMHWLASSNYELAFAASTEVSSRVLFPNGPTESHGMEDARMVRFVRPDGTVVYYATYTAYDGFSILPQLIETADFEVFRIATLNGPAARNKGIAIFPRRVGGLYAALGRSDGESNYLMLSDHIRFWHRTDRIQLPVRDWELMQIGNAGAPIETEAGWLVLTHGVGPMRQYALGAILLDLDDPARVIGHLKEPLLVPADDERDGYVPNVVYSCGSLIHSGRLVVPYGISDVSTGFATMPVDALLEALTAR